MTLGEILGQLLNNLNKELCLKFKSYRFSEYIETFSVSKESEFVKK